MHLASLAHLLAQSDYHDYSHIQMDLISCIMFNQLNS